jgi:hypothetical protein
MGRLCRSRGQDAADRRGPARQRRRLCLRRPRRQARHAAHARPPGRRVQRPHPGLRRARGARVRRRGPDARGVRLGPGRRAVFVVGHVAAQPGRTPAQYAGRAPRHGAPADSSALPGRAGRASGGSPRLPDLLLARRRGRRHCRPLQRAAPRLRAADLPTRFAATSKIVAFWNNRDGKDHVAIVHGDVVGGQDVPVRASTPSASRATRWARCAATAAISSRPRCTRHRDAARSRHRCSTCGRKAAASAS